MLYPRYITQAPKTLAPLATTRKIQVIKACTIPRLMITLACSQGHHYSLPPLFPDLQLSATESSSALEKAGLKPDATARESQRELQLAGCTWGIGERRTFTNSKPVTFEYG